MLILYAGGIPKELEPSDCAFLSGVPVKMVYGDQDQFFTLDRLEQEKIRAEELFGKATLKRLLFPGKHELKGEVIKQLLSE